MATGWKETQLSSLRPVPARGRPRNAKTYKRPWGPYRTIRSRWAFKAKSFVCAVPCLQRWPWWCGSLQNQVAPARPSSTPAVRAAVRASAVIMTLPFRLESSDADRGGNLRPHRRTIGVQRIGWTVLSGLPSKSSASLASGGWSAPAKPLADWIEVLADDGRFRLVAGSEVGQVHPFGELGPVAERIV